MPVHPNVLAALEAALRIDPEDAHVRVYLAALLLEAGEAAAALDHFNLVLERDAAHAEALEGAVAAAEDLGDQARADGYRRLLRVVYAIGPQADADATPETTLDAAPPKTAAPPGAARVPGRRLLEDVPGRDELKRRLTAVFLGPLRSRGMVKMYGEFLRGGFLLYGPPGCGKRFVAEALAGELRAEFVAVDVRGLIDAAGTGTGMRLRDLFGEAANAARNGSSTALFFEHVDAFGRARNRLRAHDARPILDTFLEGIEGAANGTGVYVLEATDTPWDVHASLRRAGRFDRAVFVPPPDEPARAAIVSDRLKGRPAETVDIPALATRTKGYSAIDLMRVCDAAARLAFDESVTTGTPWPISMSDMLRALALIEPSPRPWFELARNYASLANEGGVYDELLAHLRAEE